MEIVFTNLSEQEPCYEGYEEDFQKIMERAGKILNRSSDLVCSVIFTTPEQIHQMNKEYRNVDRPTDVISFALQDDKSDILIEEEEEELGDIFINVQAIKDQAREYGHSEKREACFLFCHGFLHLLGYDHMTPEDEKVMFGLQDEILDEVAHR